MPLLAMRSSAEVKALSNELINPAVNRWDVSRAELVAGGSPVPAA